MKGKENQDPVKWEKLTDVIKVLVDDGSAVHKVKSLVRKC